MPFLRDFDELVTETKHQQQERGVVEEETRMIEQQQQQQASSLSERIKALETAGIIDSFVKKRVPPYAAAAAAVGSTFQQQQQQQQQQNESSHHHHHHLITDKQVTKIYRNPSTGFHTTQQHQQQQQQQQQQLKTSSSTNLHSSSSRESLASNEVPPPGALVSNLYRSASVDSIENELPVVDSSGGSRRPSQAPTLQPPTTTRPANSAELPSSFQSELVDRIKTLRKVSSSMMSNKVDQGGEIPISIPLESVNRISISSSASPSPAGGINKQQVESNSSSSLSSSINKPNDGLPMSGEDLYKTSFVIYPESNHNVSTSSRVQAHSPIATLDFKIPIAAAAVATAAATTTQQSTNGTSTTNKTIIHIDSQFMTTTTTTGASSPASSSQYSAANELLLPAASFAKSTGPYSSSCCLEEPIQALTHPHHHHHHHHHHNHANPNNRSQLLIFNSEYTRTAGGMSTNGNNQNFHTEHFSCFNCNQSLTGSRYILKEEHPYCIKCYETLFANACKECGKKIGTDSKDLSYKDQHWHEKCFFCHVCKIPLVDKPFGSKNETLYCAECYNQAFASRCDKCAQIFKPGMKKMEYKGQQFHENCFLCFTCSSPIGTKSFIPKDNKIFCVTCYEQAYATKCTKCAKVISSGGVSYKNLPYHRECFTCTNCQQSLAGQRFTSRDDHPYCSECFGKLFAKKCFSCHKPITGIGGTKYISFEDRHWHNECFVCNQCHTSLVGRGFLTDAMDILCPECGRN